MDPLILTEFLIESSFGLSITEIKILFFSPSLKKFPVFSLSTRTKMSSWPVLSCPLTVWTSPQSLNVRTLCSAALFPQKLKNHHLLGVVPLFPSYLLIKSTSCLQLYSLLVLCNLDVSTGHVLIVVDSSWQVTAGPVVWTNPHQAMPQ